VRIWGNITIDVFSEWFTKLVKFIDDALRNIYDFMENSLYVQLAPSTLVVLLPVVGDTAVLVLLRGRS